MFIISNFVNFLLQKTLPEDVQTATVTTGSDGTRGLEDLSKFQEFLSQENC